MSHKCCISLPETLWQKAHRRQVELGYSCFSHYVANLVRRDRARVPKTKPGNGLKSV